MLSFIIEIPIWMLIIASLAIVTWLTQAGLQIFVKRLPLVQARKLTRGIANTTNEQPPVSIVVYAHNQADELLRNLPVLLDCNYPEFEVIVVDDGSVDDTSNVITQMEQRSTHFRYTSINKRVRNVSHKKLAMMLGVKAAQYDYILLTQAQCMPVSANWIASMMRHFTDHTDVVMGPVSYESRTGLMNRFYQWDLFERMTDMMALTLGVQPYGGWAQNLAFRKSCFYANNNQAFASHLHVHPGEDDLFVAAVRNNRQNITAECGSESLVIDQVSPLRYGWKKDRFNRSFTSQYYANGAAFVKHLDTLTRWVFMATCLTLMAYSVVHLAWSWIGLSVFLLLTHWLGVALIPYQTSKAFGVHRYWLAPITSELITPLVDLTYRLKACFMSSLFEVARLGK